MRFIVYSGKPSLTISAKRTDDSVTLRPIRAQQFRYFEDEHQNYVTVRAEWYSRTALAETPMYIIAIPEGEWSVYIRAEGWQPTASTTDPNKGKEDGLIAYAVEGPGWNIGENNNVLITNNRAVNSVTMGHPDYVINDCHFKQQQGLQADGEITCHVKTTGPDATVFIVGPPVQKQSKYNYCVSYGEWTDRNMELGQLTIVLDQKASSLGSRAGTRFEDGNLKGKLTTAVLQYFQRT